jgi:hypothetical protein
MKPKYSPGPWSVYDYPDWNGPKTKAQIRDQNGAIILITASTGGEYYDAPKDALIIQANAVLAAAAPTMLSVLQTIVASCTATNNGACDCQERSWYRLDHDSTCPIAIAKHAIAIATKE